MLEAFYPNLMVDKAQDIDIHVLKEKKIKGLILDIDNTLVPTHVKEADSTVVEWIERLKQEGFKVCIVSNATRKRVIKFNERLKLYAIHRARKPALKAFKKAVRLMDIQPEETAVVGDQVFTDIFGGNRIEMFTILVNPLHEKEFFYVRLKRLPERFILSRFKRSLEKED